MDNSVKDDVFTLFLFEDVYRNVTKARPEEEEREREDGESVTGESVEQDEQEGNGVH